MITPVLQLFASSGVFFKESGRPDAIRGLRSFIAMYRPHKAREETVLFPALRAIVSRDEYEEMGEEFEEKERRLFGPDGFDKNMNAVSELEKEFNIFNLSEFTSKIEK